MQSHDGVVAVLTRNLYSSCQACLHTRLQVTRLFTCCDHARRAMKKGKAVPAPHVFPQNCNNHASKAQSSDSRRQRQVQEPQEGQQDRQGARHLPNKDRTPSGLTTSQSTKTTFLDLPAELRNQVYEQVLLEPDPMSIGTARWPRKEPALLHASRQIRNDCLGIWYQGNRFQTSVKNFNASLVVAWQKHTSAIALALKGTYDEAADGRPLQIEIRRGRNWKNMLKWCKTVHEGGSPNVQLTGQQVRTRRGVEALLKMAEAMRGVEWEKCSEALNATRKALAAYDAEWSHGA